MYKTKKNERDTEIGGQRGRQTDTQKYGGNLLGIYLSDTELLPILCTVLGSVPSLLGKNK